MNLHLGINELLKPFREAKEKCEKNSSWVKAKSNTEKAKLMFSELDVLTKENIKNSLDNAMKLTSLIDESEYEARVSYQAEIAELYAKLDFQNKAFQIIEIIQSSIKDIIDNTWKAAVFCELGSIYLALSLEKQGKYFLNKSFWLALEDKKDIDNRDLILCEIAFAYAGIRDYKSFKRICSKVHDTYEVFFRVLKPLIEKAIYWEDDNLILDLLAYANNIGYKESLLYTIAEECIKNKDLQKAEKFIQEIEDYQWKISQLILLSRAYIDKRQFNKAIESLDLAEYLNGFIQGETSREIITKEIDVLLSQII